MGGGGNSSLPIIGITSGLKGLLLRAPTVKLGPWTVPPGLYIFWTVALLLVAIGYVSGWLPELGSFSDPPMAIAAYWGTLAAASKIVRNAIVGGSGGGGAEQPAGA